MDTIRRCMPLRALAASTSGVAVIEFAIALPVFLTAVLGGLELANLVITQQRVAEIASSVAENAARGLQQTDEADVHQLFTGAELGASGTAVLTSGRLILSSVRLNAAKNGQWIEWQRCDGSDKTIKSAYGIQGTGKTDSSLQKVGSGTGIKAPDGVDIMVVEVQTTYDPLIGNAFTSFIGTKKLSATAAHVVRDRTTFGIKNDGNLTASQIKTC